MWVHARVDTGIALGDMGCDAQQSHGASDVIGGVAGVQGLHDALEREGIEFDEGGESCWGAMGCLSMDGASDSGGLEFHGSFFPEAIPEGDGVAGRGESGGVGESHAFGDGLEGHGDSALRLRIEGRGGGIDGLAYRGLWMKKRQDVWESGASQSNQFALGAFIGAFCQRTDRAIGECFDVPGIEIEKPWQGGIGRGGDEGKQPEKQERGEQQCGNEPYASSEGVAQHREQNSVLLSVDEVVGSERQPSENSDDQSGEHPQGRVFDGKNHLIVEVFGRGVEVIGRRCSRLARIDEPVFDLGADHRFIKLFDSSPSSGHGTLGSRIFREHVVGILQPRIVIGRLRQAFSLEASQDDGDVVMAASVVGFFDQRLASFGDIGVIEHRLSDVVVPNHAAEPVGAHEQNIALPQGDEGEVDLNGVCGAEGLEDDIVVFEVFGFFFGELAGFDELIDEGLVAGDLDEMLIS